MKKLITIVTLSILGAIGVRAQQDPMFTQYMFNEITVNPAYAGSHKVLSATLLYRNQWTGFDGNPRTSTFNIHSPLKNERIGVGLSLINDAIGVSNNFNLYANGSYMIPFSEQSHLAFGLQAGFTHVRESLNDLDVAEDDDAFSGGTTTGMLPNVGAGIHFETHNYYIGFSVPKLMGNSLASNDVNSFKTAQHYFLTTGYLFKLNPLWMIKPAVMVKAVTGAPVNADYSIDVIYDETYTLGFAYRSGESFDIMAMYQLNTELRIGYSYDITLNGLRNYNSGSHEIIVNYRFSHDKSKVETPRFF